VMAVALAGLDRVASRWPRTIHAMIAATIVLNLCAVMIRIFAWDRISEVWQPYLISG